MNRVLAVNVPHADVIVDLFSSQPLVLPGLNGRSEPLVSLIFFSFILFGILDSSNFKLNHFGINLELNGKSQLSVG